jgi:predicted transcriptional regulator
MTLVTTKNKQYRSKHEIIYLILETLGKEGAKLTAVLYGAFVSYVQVKEYLQELTKIGLISDDEKIKVYRITEKGRRYMEIYRVLRTHLGEKEGQEYGSR